MAYALYMDVHVPARVTEALLRRHVDVLTSQDDGTREVSDEQLLVRTIQLNWLMVTQDEDFLVIASEWQRDAREFPGVVFAPQGISIGRFISDLELLATCSLSGELINRVIHLPLR